MKNPCMAHRGCSGEAPENTMAAFELAINDEIVSSIELDVQLSYDGVPVVIHDFSLERTTNGRGLVQDTSFRDLRQLDAGRWFAESFAGEKIPALEEVLEATRGKKRLNIELKKMGVHHPGLEEKVIRLVKKYNMEEQVMITSFYHPALRIVKDLAPYLKTGPIMYGRPILLKEQLDYLHAEVLSIAYPYITPQLVNDLLLKGNELVAWTIDEPDHMIQIAALDERIHICTNYPKRWRHVANR